MKGVMKFIYAIATALLLVPATQAVGAEAGLQMETGGAVLTNMSIGLLTGIATQGQVTAFAALNKEVWVPGLEDLFRFYGTWYDRLRDMSQFAGNEVVNLAKAGADPDVLISPSYPLTAVAVTDVASTAGFVPFVTTPSVIQDDELVYLAYDKKAETRSRHEKKLKRTIQKWTLHAIAPQTEVAGKQLIQVATGAAVGGGDTRLRLKFADLDTLAYRLNKLEWPQEGRVLVLCPEHQLDLKLESRSLYNEIFDRKSSVPMGRYADFEIYEDTTSVSYTALNVKDAYGTAVSGTKRHASVMFMENRGWKADGTVKFYSDEDINNPLTHAAMLNLKQYHGAGALYAEGTCAIVSPAS